MQDQDELNETVNMNYDSNSYHLNDDGLASDFCDFEDGSGLPCTLIVAHVPDAVFDFDETKTLFEQLFCSFESLVKFQYLKTFRRARVVFSKSSAATRARIQLHEHVLLGSTIKCYFAQTSESDTSPSSSSQYLLPPKPDKQFLISPPSSPPEGWESVYEKQPTINYDLIAAITKLTPGVAHEVQTASESQPGIVVHVCEDPEGFKSRPMILQTRCPQYADP